MSEVISEKVCDNSIMNGYVYQNIGLICDSIFEYFASEKYFNLLKVRKVSATFD